MTVGSTATGRRNSFGTGPLERKHFGQMVPATAGAHLDDVTDERLFVPPSTFGQRGELLEVRHTTTECRQRRAEDVGDKDQLVVRANRARLGGRPTTELRRPTKLGMGITDV